MYENANYVKDTLTGQNVCIRVEINGITSFVPLDPANTDYQEYLAWLEEGNEPLPPEGEGK